MHAYVATNPVTKQVEPTESIEEWSILVYYFDHLHSQKDGCFSWDSEDQATYVLVSLIHISARMPVTYLVDVDEAASCRCHCVWRRMLSSRTSGLQAIYSCHGWSPVAMDAATLSSIDTR